MSTPNLGAPSATTVRLSWGPATGGVAPYTYDVRVGTGAQTPSARATPSTGRHDEGRFDPCYGLVPSTPDSGRIVTHDEADPAVQVATATAVAAAPLSGTAAA